MRTWETRRENQRGSSRIVRKREGRCPPQSSADNDPLFPTHALALRKAGGCAVVLWNALLDAKTARSPVLSKSKNACH